MPDILLTQGQVAKVDEADYKWLNQWKWFAQWHSTKRNFYVARKVRKDGKETVVYMHRLILGLTGKSLVSDHINGNTLDNRRLNLRVATISQNSHNRIRNRVNNTSGFKGAQKSRGKWRAKIMLENKIISLGTFSTAKEAHEAYCRAAQSLHGEFANFG